VALTYVVAHDIGDDRRRAQVAALLQAYGDRIQQSVFICVAEPDRIAEIRSRVAGIINPETDSVYMFRQCAACWDALGIHGQATAAGEPPLLGRPVGLVCDHGQRPSPAQDPYQRKHPY
jgi:CRISPR-associated protein Cas2